MCGMTWFAIVGTIIMLPVVLAVIGWIIVFPIMIFLTFLEAFFGVDWIYGFMDFLESPVDLNIWKRLRPLLLKIHGGNDGNDKV